MGSVVDIMDADSDNDLPADTAFRALAENAREGIVIETEDGPVYVNPFAAELTGYTLEELRGMRSEQVLAPGELERVAGFTRGRLKGEEVPSFYESAVLTKDGREIAVEVTAARSFWEGKPAAIGFLRDISARKEAERALRESEEMLARAQSVARVGSWQCDYASRQLVCSAEFYRVYGLDPATFGGDIDELVDTVVHPDDRESLRGQIERAIIEQKTEPFEFRAIVNGQTRIIRGNGSIVRDDWGEITGTIGTVQDITERRRLEQELLNISQAEQQRVGRDLHDTLGQELAGITFLAKALERDLSKGQSELAEQARYLARLSGDALNRARRIAHGLAPVDVSAEGLAAALHQLCRDTAAVYRIICRCEVATPGLVYDNAVAAHLYYIAQEAILNAIRHGRAKRIRVSLETGVEGELQVRDDGQWLDREEEGHAGMGLRIMRYRADLIGGKVRVLHDGESGTRVAVAFGNRKI